MIFILRVVNVVVLDYFLDLLSTARKKRCPNPPLLFSSCTSFLASSIPKQQEYEGLRTDKIEDGFFFFFPISSAFHT
jgi:hypothetical protein